MPVEVTLNTPLAEALTNVVQPKLSEVGWSTGDLDDSALGEYIILMLVNGKTQEQIASELSNDLLSLGPDDTGATEFARWLFEQVETLNSQLNGVLAQLPQTQHTQAIPSYQEQGRLSNGGNTVGTDVDMGEAMEAGQDGVIPTGPKSMRNGSRPGNKRMIGQLSKAMDRTGDAVLHRVRPQQGTERINMHNRQPPKGPRNEQLWGARPTPNGRLTGMPSGGIVNGGVAGPLAQMTPQQQMQLITMYEEQARMMSQIFSPQQQQNLMPGMVQPAINPAFGNGGIAQSQHQARSLFDRVESNPHRQNAAFNKRPHQNGNSFQPHACSENRVATNGTNDSANADISSSMEVESSQTAPGELSTNDVCRYNLKCTNKDCQYAHQSPEAPPGTTVDVSDTCPFGAACKNRKCVGRHPSPAQRVDHKTQMECKFWPNCNKEFCPFRHPMMPMCKNGADCTREGCKFTHVKVLCKFNPCLNPQCPYKHAEGQKRGHFGDKVWVADGSQEAEHVSERKFVRDEMAEEELIVPVEKTEEPDIKNEDQGHGSQHSTEVVT